MGKIIIAMAMLLFISGMAFVYAGTVSTGLGCISDLIKNAESTGPTAVPPVTAESCLVAPVEATPPITPPITPGPEKKTWDFGLKVSEDNSGAMLEKAELNKGNVKVNSFDSAGCTEINNRGTCTPTKNSATITAQTGYKGKDGIAENGTFYVFGNLDTGNYFFTNNIVGAESSVYPTRALNEYISITSEGKIFLNKISAPAAASAEAEQDAAWLEGTADCTPIITKLVLKGPTKPETSAEAPAGITLEIWNETIAADPGKNIVEFDKGNKVEVTFKSPDAANCPIYQYTYEIWTKDPNQACNLEEGCKATARIQAASNQAKTPIGQPLTPAALTLNSATGVFTKGSSTITLGSALGPWTGNKTVWLRVETTKSTTDPLQWDDSPSFPIVLTKGVVAPPVQPAEEITKGWDSWILWEQLPTTDCKTIVECLARIDRWLVGELKKKL